MNKENYISLRAEDVHKRLITDIAQNLDVAKEFLDELTATDRYKEDHVFRASVEASKVYLLSYAGHSSEVVKRCFHLIEVATILREWELLSFDYNMMANAYFLLGMYEKALEYYYNAINNETEHGLKNTLPVSYANIGLICLNVGLNEKALEYLSSAIEYIEYADKDYFRFREKKIHILSDIMTAITKMDNPDPGEVEKIFNCLNSFDIEGIDKNTLYSYYLGLMYYYFWKKDFEKAKKEYIRAREVVGNNSFTKLVVLYSFIEECDKGRLALEFFEKELLEAEYVEKDENAIDEPVVYTNLKKYYLSKGNKEKVEEVEKKYRTFLEDNLKMSQKKQADSIQIIENVLKSKIKLI